MAKFHFHLFFQKDDDVSVKSEEESTEEVFQMIDRKNRRSLRYKRGFFVRMVSDPKIYNPKIVRSLSGKTIQIFNTYSI